MDKSGSPLWTALRTLSPRAMPTARPSLDDHGSLPLEAAQRAVSHSCGSITQAKSVRKRSYTASGRHGQPGSASAFLAGGPGRNRSPGLDRSAPARTCRTRRASTHSGTCRRVRPASLAGRIGDAVSLVSWKPATGRGHAGPSGPTAGFGSPPAIVAQMKTDEAEHAAQARKLAPWSPGSGQSS